jgi:hypothetical protein
VAPPPDTKRILLVVIFLVLFSGSASQVLAGKQGNSKFVTVTGNLEQALAIGGETTGWVLVLEAPLVVDSQSLKRIEVEAGGSQMARFLDRRVKIQGLLQKCSGVERGWYWVLVITEIQAIAAGK